MSDRKTDSNQKSGGRKLLLPAGILCMGISLAGGAMLLQWGNMLCRSEITEDALLPAIWSYIHPGAAGLLAAGFALSAATLIAGIRAGRRR